MSRPPSAPPNIPGFDHVKVLGTGGFADVFLYQQQLPRRQVAVKVLLTDKLGSSSADAFTSEANLMAQLATHPSIVSVYQAGIADDGRPYLVMEYCSKPNLQVRHRRERFSEAETLRVGVQIAGAVETAHRHDILHRDIKPANILVTDYGRPALTDFGIAGTTAGLNEGMSVPWAPPESFAMPSRGDATSDVYSLAATLYTLLTDRSPFQLPGASNTEIDVISRIQAMPLPPTGRPEVSASLEAVLAKAMAKDPAARYRTALEFARALQRVQIELGMQPTPVDVVEDEPDVVDEDDDEGRTRFRGITSIDAQDSAAEFGMSVPGTLPGGTSRPTTGRTPVVEFLPGAADTVRQGAVVAPVAPGPAVLGTPSAPPIPDTVVRGRAVQEPVPAAPTQRPRGRRIGWTVGAGAVLLIAVVAAAVVLVPRPKTDAPKQTPPAAQPVDPGAGGAVVPDVTRLTGKISGKDVVFTWTNPQPESGDSYLWRPVTVGQTVNFQSVTQPTVTLPAAPGQTCIEVMIRRQDGASPAAGVVKCTP